MPKRWQNAKIVTKPNQHADNPPNLTNANLFPLLGGQYASSNNVYWFLFCSFLFFFAVLSVRTTLRCFSRFCCKSIIFDGGLLLHEFWRNFNFLSAPTRFANRTQGAPVFLSWVGMSLCVCFPFIFIPIWTNSTNFVHYRLGLGAKLAGESFFYSSLGLIWFGWLCWFLSHFVENRFIPDTLGDPRPGKGLFDISTDWGPHCIVACAPIRSFFGGRSKQRTRTGNNGFWTVFEHFFFS